MDAQDFSNFESILFVNTVFENKFRCFYNDEKNKQILFEDEDKSLTGSPLSEVKYELSPVSQSFQLDLMPMTSSPILIRPQSTGSFSSSCDSEPQVRRKIGNYKCTVWILHNLWNINPETANAWNDTCLWSINPVQTFFLLLSSSVTIIQVLQQKC